MFLEEDGLDVEWENGSNIWETSLGDHEDSDVTNYAPSFMLERLTNRTRFDMTSVGNNNTTTQLNLDNNEDMIDYEFDNVENIVANMETATNEHQINETDKNENNITNVNDLTMEEFRKELTDHFDVLFQKKQLIWPKRLGEQRLNYH
jgi:hypothetical protein